MGVLAQYNNSLKKALTTIYPSITFDPAKFQTVSSMFYCSFVCVCVCMHLTEFNNSPEHFWMEKENRRKLLDSFAKEKGFDPQKLESWKNITVYEVRRFKVCCAYTGEQW